MAVLLNVRLGVTAILSLVAISSFAMNLQGQSLTFTRLAGSEGGPGFVDATGSAARFSEMRGLATDSQGNVYVLDRGNFAIRKITPAGAVSTLADIAAGEAVATDRAMNVYVVEGHSIRKITAAGAVTTIAGQQGAGGSADGHGSEARFLYPSGLATDIESNVYVADTGNFTIRKITPEGLVTTIAGVAGTAGSADGIGSTARFSGPYGMAVDNSGNVYVTDRGAIRKLTPEGAVTTLAGSANQQGYADGIGNAARFTQPYGVTTDRDGNLYVCDYNHTIRKISPAGIVTTLAGRVDAIGSSDGIGSAARFNFPNGIVTDPDGDIYVSDRGNYAIRRVSAEGEVTTVAGLAPKKGSVDGTGGGAQFAQPAGLAADESGNVYVAETSARTIRKIAPDGTVTTFAGRANSPGAIDGTGEGARFRWPEGVAADVDGNIFVADANNHTIRKITPGGVVTTFAGKRESQGSDDGPASTARFSSPRGVATDTAGNVYVADSGNNIVRKITPDGQVTTLAGLAGSDGYADGAGSNARFAYPLGIATSNDGNVYVAEASNHTVRKITPQGEVTTLAGVAGIVGSADGKGAEARFSSPYGVAADRNGTIYVTARNTIRRITPDGEVTTIAGVAGVTGSMEGTGRFARFAASGVATGRDGYVYVVDYEAATVYVGKPALADMATIDLNVGVRGDSRRLDTSPQTATSWQWDVMRRPAGSVAVLSSSTIRNPTFTPDVSGVFVFRLSATNGSKTSITTVSFFATPRASPARRRLVRR